MACGGGRKVKVKNGEVFLKLVFCLCFSVLFFRVLIPLSIAESDFVGRVNSPGKANLALRAGTARQGGLVGNNDRFRHPERFFRDNRIRTAFSGYSFGLLQKSTSPAVRIPQCQTKGSK